MPQTRYGIDHYRPNLIPSTVSVRRALRVKVYECTAKTRSGLEEVERRTSLLLSPSQDYHALINDKTRDVRVFVPYAGFIEEVTISLDEIVARHDRTGEDVDYRKWGNNRIVEYTVEALGE